MTKMTWPRAVVLIVFVVASIVLFFWARQLGEEKASEAANRVTLDKLAAMPPSLPNRKRLDLVDDLQPDPLMRVADSAPAQMKRKKPKREPGLVRLAAELVREFPEVPDVLKRRCKSRERGGVVELACQDGVDALVDYQLAKDGTWATLTILGPPGTDERGACRDWLVRNTPGAKPFGMRQRNDELQMYFVRGDTRFMASFLTMARRNSGALCSVMACLEDGLGQGTQCREPLD